MAHRGQLAVVHLVQLAHATRADVAGDFVGAELGAAGYWHRRSRVRPLKHGPDKE
jgi:hypothetical protein